MILNSKVQYAVLLIEEIKSSQTIAVPLKRVSDKHGLSLQFLEQVARKMRIAGLIKSRRGPGGGYVAGDKLANASLMSVLESVESCKLKVAVKTEDSKLKIESLDKQIKEVLDSLKV